LKVQIFVQWKRDLLFYYKKSFFVFGLVFEKRGGSD